MYKNSLTKNNYRHFYDKQTHYSKVPNQVNLRFPFMNYFRGNSTTKNHKLSQTRIMHSRYFWNLMLLNHYDYE